MSIPVIDLFAGPGGLGEGFSRASTPVKFNIAVSIEKDGMAHETLRLRAAHRVLARDPKVTRETWMRWDVVISREPWNIVFEKLQNAGDPAIERACKKAHHEALNLELGPAARREANKAIRERLAPYIKGGELPANSVLIGGPPCQAYSIVGRSRNKGTPGYEAENDPRHFLYLEYLHVIAEFKPAVFVMENVKGILTSKVKERQMFQTIVHDLKRPDIVARTRSPVEYVLHALPAVDGLLDDPTPEDFIVKAEEYGVPQARHRVIIIGVRKDVFGAVGHVGKLRLATPPTVWDVISDLPRLRPQLSYRGKDTAWPDVLDSPLLQDAINELRLSRDATSGKVAEKLEEVRARLLDRKSDPGHGSDRSEIATTSLRRKIKALEAWYVDRETTLLANHESRSHMPSDLIRYLFVAAFGEVHRVSPKLAEFPRCLLPDHNNVDPDNISDSIFKDRFRVQVGTRHSMTVTSHIAKDGHAFIHPKAAQCRSLTVREAARLQTFPDSYVFLGNRTSQYTQVGNAVPPYLAQQIAKVVADVLKRANLA